MESLPDRPLPSRPVTEVVVAWVRWFGVVRLVVTVLAVLAVGACAFWLVRSPATPIENKLPLATPSAVSTSTSPPVPSGNATAGTDDPARPSAENVIGSPTIIVYVAGSVVNAGVYELPGGARVQQAVLAAGGVTGDADVDALNLAGFLNDGDRIYVPRVGVPVPIVVSPGGGSLGGSASPTAEASGPLDLNRASVEQLDELPGIGPSTAAAIVAHREASGPFVTVDGLLDVRGIGPSKLEAIRSMVSV